MNPGKEIAEELEGDLKGALEDFQQSVTLDPSVQRLNSLAAGLMAARRYPEAAAALQRSIALRESAGARTRLIAAYDRLGWREQATRLRRHADRDGGSAVPFEAALAAGDTVAYERARGAELRNSADSLIARLTMADVPPGERYNVDYLEVESTTPHTPLAEYLLREATLIFKAYSNHPSFTMFTLGNELGRTPAMYQMVAYFKEIDPRHLYAQGANNMHWAPSFAEGDDFWVTGKTGKSLPVRVRFSRRIFPRAATSSPAPRRR